MFKAFLASLFLIFLSLSAHAEKCPFYPNYFRDLKKIYLYVDYDFAYESAIDCRGHETECAKDNVVKVGAPQEQIDNAIVSEASRLKKLSDSIPPVLYPAHVTDLFQVAVNHSLAKFGLSGECPLPRPELLGHEQIDIPDQNKGSLTITLGVKIIDTTPVHLAVLDVQYFRADNQNSMYEQMRPRVTAIPFDLQEGKVEAILSDLFRSGVREPWTRFPAQP